MPNDNLTTAPSMDRLPVKKLEPLLDKHGLEGTWKRLLSAYVSGERPEFTDSILSASWFDGIEPHEENILHGLTIGQHGVLYEFSLAHVDHTSRKNEGQYFTPDDVAQFMAKRCSGFDEGVWLDPCSGVGNLSYWLAASQDDPESFVRDKLILTDRDPIALQIARVLLCVAFQNRDTELYHKMGENFKVRDFLVDEVPAHDYVLVNPPYVGVPENTAFTKTSKARDTYAYFLERIVDTSKGFVSITPQSFTNSEKFSGFRDMLRDTDKGFDIYCFDNVPDSIFKGIKFGSKNTNKVNSTRAAVIVLGKSDERRITPLLRWRSSERNYMLERADEFLGEMPKAHLFPKVSADLLELYNAVSGLPNLASVTSKKQTEFALTVPSTPRYFIPAVKRSLERSSAKTVYFHTSEERDLYYPYLNSSLLYWWWRVNDGGMTLSLDTLNRLPLIQGIEAQPELVKELEMSEQQNVVIKMNAGKPNENVKHQPTLVQQINATYFPEYATSLMGTHSNSVFL